MNDDLMLEYLLNMGAMQPQQQDMKRRQAMVDALREGAMTPQKGQMVSGHYVAPGLAGMASQLGQAYMAKQGQGAVDDRMGAMNTQQRQMLEQMRDELRKRRGMQGMPSYDEQATANNADLMAQFGAPR